jgi:hypothetical protein
MLLPVQSIGGVSSLEEIGRDEKMAVVKATKDAERDLEKFERYAGEAADVDSVTASEYDKFALKNPRRKLANKSTPEQVEAAMHLPGAIDRLVIFVSYCLSLSFSFLIFNFCNFKA